MYLVLIKLVIASRRFLSASHLDCAGQHQRQMRRPPPLCIAEEIDSGSDRSEGLQAGFEPVVHIEISRK
jgi:hypothetical protein